MILDFNGQAEDRRVFFSLVKARKTTNQHKRVHVGNAEIKYVYLSGIWVYDLITRMNINGAGQVAGFQILDSKVL